MKKECNLVLIHSTHKPRMFLHYTIENPNTVPLEGYTVTVAKKMFTQLANEFKNLYSFRFIVKSRYVFFNIRDNDTIVESWTLNLDTCPLVSIGTGLY